MLKPRKALFFLNYAHFHFDTDNIFQNRWDSVMLSNALYDFFL